MSARSNNEAIQFPSDTLRQSTLRTCRWYIKSEGGGDIKMKIQYQTTYSYDTTSYTIFIVG